MTEAVPPKPAHLGRPYAEQFADAAIVAAYRFRPPYPPATFDVLATLLGEKGGAVLDVGCGRGDLTLPLARIADRVDAVDPSQGMIAAARGRAGGDHSGVRWIEAPIETARLEGPYALVTAGQSLHWTEWAVALPRLAGLLVPAGWLAIVDRRFLTMPWDEELRGIIPRYSTNRDYEPYDVVEELEARALFQLEGGRDVDFVPFRQGADDYVEALHSANGFSRDRMSAPAAADFDREVRALLRTHGIGEAFDSGIGARIRWGRPRAPEC